MNKLTLILIASLQALLILQPNIATAQEDDYSDVQYNYTLEDVYRLSAYNFSELGYYCGLGNLDKVKELVESGADIDRVFSWDWFAGGHFFALL